MTSSLRRMATVLAVVGLAVVIWCLSPAPGAVAASLRHPQNYVDRLGADQLVLAWLPFVAWAVLAWSAVGLVLTAAATLPGAIGRGCDELADRILPETLHRAATVALGISVVTAGGIPAATSMTVTGGAPVDGTKLALRVDWPAGIAPFNPDWPSAPPAQHRRHAPASAETRIVVAPGDSLWRIAARWLGPGATDAQIAQAWPRWYAANRQLIGPDPNLIRPGQRLVPPPGWSFGDAHSSP